MINIVSEDVINWRDGGDIFSWTNSIHGKKERKKIQRLTNVLTYEFRSLFVIFVMYSGKFFQ